MYFYIQSHLFKLSSFNQNTFLFFYGIIHNTSKFEEKISICLRVKKLNIGSQIEQRAIWANYGDKNSSAAAIKPRFGSDIRNGGEIVLNCEKIKWKIEKLNCIIWGQKCRIGGGQLVAADTIAGNSFIKGGISLGTGADV